LFRKVTAVDTCPECQKRLREYERAIGEIYALVDTRLPTRWEKITRLRQWQDERDRAIENYYLHKRLHSIRYRGVKAA